MDQKKRNPDGANVRVPANINSFRGEIDGWNHSPEPLDLQAFRLRQRFHVSWSVARAAAEIAFANGRAA